MRPPSTYEAPVFTGPCSQPRPTQAESEVKKCNDWQTTGDGDGGEAMTTLIITVTSIRYQLLQLQLSDQFVSRGANKIHAKFREAPSPC